MPAVVSGDRGWSYVGPGHVCSWIHTYQGKSWVVTVQVLAASWLLSVSFF